MDTIFYSYTFILGLILSYFDLKSQEYPLIIWLVMTLILLPFYPANLTFLLLCLLGIFSIIRNIAIGAGDFFYLATLGLSIHLTELLWTVQLASLLGIAFYLLKLNKQKTIAFLPFLLAGFALVLMGKYCGFLY